MNGFLRVEQVYQSTNHNKFKKPDVKSTSYMKQSKFADILNQAMSQEEVSQPLSTAPSSLAFCGDSYRYWQAIDKFYQSSE